MLAQPTANIGIQRIAQSNSFRSKKRSLNAGTSILFLSFIAAGISAYQSKNAPNGYEFMWILPLLYGILFFTTNMRFAFFKYLGLTVLNFILIGRYLILPVFSALSGEYFHSTAIKTGHDANLYAIILMVYEMICIFIVFHFLIKKLDKESIKSQNIRLSYDTSNIYYIILILIGFASFMIVPGIRERMNFLIVKDIEYQNLNTFYSIAFLFASNSFKILFLLILSKQYLKKIKGQHVNQFLLILISLISISILFQHSRLTVLAQGITAITLLNSIKILNKKYLTIISVSILIIVVSLSSYRYFGSGELNVFYEESAGFSTVKNNSDQLQAYFGGPHLISIAINAKENFVKDANVSTFLNEILGVINFVRQVFPPEDNLSVTAFNKIFGFKAGNSMILPTLGQSYMYFGTVLAPLLSIIFSLILFRAEKALISSKTLGEKYALYILVVWLAFFPMQNINIITVSIFNIFLPFYLIVLINQKLKSL